MSQSGQSLAHWADGVGWSLEVEVARFPAGFRSAWHHTPRAQLIYPSRGVMTLQTPGGVWVVPPLRGCWLPAFEDHSVETPGGLEMHSVYVWGDTPPLPDASGIVAVSSLMRQLILALAETDGRDHRRPAMAWLLVDSIAVLPQTPLYAPQLRQARLARIAAALAADPADPRRLEDWGRELGATPRTLARAFAQEAGMPFSEYRRQARLFAAIHRLAAGQPVTRVAHDLGFASASAFTAMFRRATGVTPSAYFA